MARSWTAALIAALIVGLTACGTAPGPQSTAKPAPQAGQQPAQQPAQATHVTLQLPWLISGEDAGFYVAQEKGYYKQAGLDVSMSAGTSSLQAAEVVANGKATFGFADATAVAGVISGGGQEKVIAQLDHDTGVGIIYSPKSPITGPESLRGRTILANSAGGPVVAMLHALLAKYKIPQSEVHLNIVATSAEASNFKTHPEDPLLGFSNATYPAVLQIVPEAQFFFYSKLGVNTLSYAVISSNEEMRTQPDVVRRFVAASLQGWKWAMANQAEAAAIQAKAAPQTPEPTVAAGLKYTVEGFNNPPGKPFGYATRAQWQETLDLLHTYAGLKTVLPVEDYYTNEFLPQS